MKNFNLNKLINSVYRLFMIICITILLLQTYYLNEKVETFAEIQNCYYQIDNYPTLRNVEVMYARIDSIKNNLQNR